VAFDKMLKDYYPDLDVASSEIKDGRETILLKMKDKRAEELKKLAVEQSLENNPQSH